MPASRRPSPRLATAALGLALALGLTPGQPAHAQRARSGPRFFDDDPVTRVVDTQDASKVAPREISLAYDASINLFGRPGAPFVGRAESVNSIDEVPDSNWYVNRSGLTGEQIRRGVDADTGPVPGQWAVSRKSNGVSPGFTITDVRGRRYFVKFDPPGLPELATGAEAVVTRLFHALGYYVPQLNIGTLRREDLVIAKDATVRAADGSRRRMHQSDLDEQLSRAHRNPDGTYRVSLAVALDGRPLEGFKYEGTRPDDPNDIIPHENRRELRGLRVFSAWLNHTDAKAINSMDTLVTENGRAVVRHHLIDFNATLGSAGIELRDPRDGYEYLAEAGAAMRALPAFGFKVREWMRIEYPSFRGIGRFEAQAFRPQEWRPRVPNPAYVRSRADDTFWGAHKLMALPEAVIRGAVDAGQYSDPEARRFLVEALLERRRRIARAWLTTVNPVVDPSLEPNGDLVFRNAAVDAGVASAPAAYEVTWFRFDNATGDASRLGSSRVQGPGASTARVRVAAVPGLPDRPGAWLQLDIAAAGPPDPSWSKPVRAWFHRLAAGWKLVGFDRMPGAPPMRPGMVGAELTK